jgi:HEAT repeat protein
MPLIRKPAWDKRKPDTAAAQPDAVLAALTDGNEDERWAAARAAVSITGAVDALAAALRLEADARVREAMFTSLTRIGSSESVGAIIPLLRADDASLRTGAIDALRAMPVAVLDYMPALVSDADTDVRILSCDIARVLPGEQATSIMSALLAREPDANVCAAAIDVLAEVGGPAVLPALDSCAARFPQMPFIAFAVRIARDRILSQTAKPHG